jgi:hypothetical protein
MAGRHLARELDALPPMQPEPEDGTCRRCYQWRRYPPGQEHFGYAWWRICPHGCDCAHHADEIWIA